MRLITVLTVYESREKRRNAKQTSTLDWILRQHGEKGVIHEHLGMVLGKIPTSPIGSAIALSSFFSFRGVCVYQLLQVLVSISTLISDVDNHHTVRLDQFECRPYSACLAPLRLLMVTGRGARHLFSQLTSQRCASSICSS